MITIEHHLQDLTQSIERYSKVNKKLTEGEAVMKQVGKLSFALSRELKGISPAKGSLRTAGLTGLSSGKGIKVRQSVKDWALRKHGNLLGARSNLTGKRRGQLLNANRIKKGKKPMNLQALAVRRELSVRESARGFLSVSARYPGVANISKGLATATRSEGWYKNALSQAGITYEQNGTVLRFQWNPGISSQSGEAAEGLSTPKGHQAIIRAIKATKADIEVYIARKQSEAIRKALR